MDMQELFNKAVGGIYNQGKPSYQPSMGSDAGVCMYRGPEGVKCAVGFIIDDEFYYERLEHSTVEAVEVTEAVNASIGRGITESEKVMMMRIQNVHGVMVSRYGVTSLSSAFGWGYLGN